MSLDYKRSKKSRIPFKSGRVKLGKIMDVLYPMRSSFLTPGRLQRVKHVNKVF